MTQTNKKDYICPETEIQLIDIDKLLMAGSTVQEESGWEDQLSKKNSFFDDWETAESTPAGKSLWDD